MRRMTWSICGFTIFRNNIFYSIYLIHHTCFGKHSISRTVKCIAIPTLFVVVPHVVKIRWDVVTSFRRFSTLVFLVNHQDISSHESKPNTSDPKTIWCHINMLVGEFLFLFLLIKTFRKTKTISQINEICKLDRPHAITNYRMHTLFSSYLPEYSLRMRLLWYLT